MEELQRQAGWAKTFGLPLELISAEEARGCSRRCPPRACSAPRTSRPTATSTRASSTFALAEGARRRGAEIRHEHAGDRNRRRARPRDRRRRDRQAATIATEVVVNAGGMFAREIGALAGRHRPDRADGARVPGHTPAGAAARPPDDARPVAPRLLPRRVRRARHGRLRAQPGALGARRDPGRLQRQAAREDWERFERADGERHRAGARLADAEVVRCQRPRGLHARRRVHPRRADVRGFWVAAGLLRARAGGGRRHGPARRGVDRRGRCRASTCGTWTPPLRRATTAAAQYTLARTVEVYSTYYDVRYPGQERQAGRPLRVSPAYARLASSARRSARSRAGSAPNWFEPNAAARRRVTAPARVGGRALVAGDRRRAPRCRERAALFDETSFAKLEVAGPGAADFLERCAPTTSTRDVGAVTYTQMLNARGGIECDFTVTRLAEERFRHRHRDGVRQPRPRLDPLSTSATTARSRSRTSRRATRASASGGRRPARSCSR